MSMVTPGERALPAPAAAANGAAVAELSDGAQPKRRRNKKPAVERELALADPKLSAFPHYPAATQLPSVTLPDKQQPACTLMRLEINGVDALLLLPA